jgi:hypothetical protein
MSKIRKLKKTENGFEGRIEEAYFLNANGERHTGADGLLRLFACSDNEAYVQEEDETHVLQSYIVQSNGLAQQPGEAKQSGLRQRAASAFDGPLTSAAATRTSARRKSPNLFFMVAPF